MAPHKRQVLVWQMPGGFAGEDLHRIGHRRLGALLVARMGPRAPELVHAGGGVDDVVRRCIEPASRPAALVLPAFRQGLWQSVEAIRGLAEVAPELAVLLSGWGAEPGYLDLLCAEEGPLTHRRLAVPRGEPEEALVDGLEAILEAEDGQWPEEALVAAGLALPDRRGGWRSRGRFRQVEELGLLPSPYETGGLTLDESDGVALIEVARGCRFRCRFCLSCNFEPGGVRQLPLDQVLAEVRRARRRGAAGLALLCSALNHDPSVIEGIADALEEIDPEGQMPVESTIHASLIDDRRLAAAGRIRWRRMIVGLQSTNRSALELMGRRVDPPAFAATVERIAAFHEPTIEIILGLPGDTLEGFRRTLSFVLDLPAKIEVYHLRLDPGSHFCRDISSLGMDADFADQGKVRSTPSFPARDIRAAIEELRAAARPPWRHRARALGFDFETLWPRHRGGRGPAVNPP